MNHKLSSLRANLRNAQAALDAILAPLLQRDPILKGSLYLLKRKCGKPSCHCNSGQLHESTVLSYRGRGRTQNLAIKPEHHDRLKSLTQQYQLARKSRTQLIRWFKQLLTLVDDLELARLQLGEAQFQKMFDPKSTDPTSE